MNFNLKKYSLFGVLILIPVAMSLITKQEIIYLIENYAESTGLLLLLPISALLIFVIWRNNKLKFYKEGYEIEKEKNILLRHYDYLSRYANDIIILLDDKGMMLQANEKAFSVYGYTQEELIGKSGKILRPENEQNKFDDIIKKIHNREGIVYETIHIKKSGERFVAEISVCPFTIEGTTYIQAIIRDATQRKKTEETVRQHAMFLDSVGQAVIATNLNLEIIYWNKAAERLFGWQKSEVINKNILDIVPLEINEDKLDEIILELKNGLSWSGEVQVRKKDETIFPVKINNSPLYNSQGEMVGIVGVYDDLTEQKIRELELLHAKDKAEEVNKLKSNFLANISHEVRTPLIGILGFSEMILEETYDSDLKEKVGEIYKSGKKLNETLDTILDISKIEAEKVNVVYERFNLGETIKESIVLYKVLAEEKGIEIKYTAGTNGLLVELDKKILSKIINNLLSNAVKYTSEGEITVSTYCNNAEVKIEIEDTGVGIPEDKLKTVFEPFRQASEGYNRRFGGTGLGLTITKILVEMMNGRIHLESQFGKGSKITIELPVYSSGSCDTLPVINEVQKKMEQRIRSFEKISLLLVEDDDVNAKIILRFLEEEYNTEWVSSGSEAIALASGKNYNGILMDISLKGELDGLTTAERIKKIQGYEASPVIAVTAHAMVGDKEKFLNGGCTHYISKPFSRNDLLFLLKNIFS